jgi:large subunit ribosomal protein L24
MKKHFSSHWIASSQTRKQRKYRANAPLHIKQKFMSGNLSKELRKKLGRRSLEVRKGDTVKLMRGKFSGRQGKINNVQLKRTRISIEGIQRQKKDGTKVNVWFNPSKIQIIEIVDDKYRLMNKKQPEKNAPEKK